MPQPRPWDDQDWRVRGAHVARDPEDLEAQVRRALRDPAPVPSESRGAEQVAAAIRERLGV